MHISKINHSFNVSMKQDTRNQINTDLTSFPQEPNLTTSPQYGLESSPLQDEITNSSEKNQNSKTNLITLGALALGIAGVGYGIYKGRKSSSTQKEIESLNDTLENIKNDLTKKEGIISSVNKKVKKLKKENKKFKINAKKLASNTESHSTKEISFILAKERLITGKVPCSFR